MERSFDIHNQADWEPSPVFLRCTLFTLLVGALGYIVMIYLLVPSQTGRYFGGTVGAVIAVSGLGLLNAGKRRASVKLLAFGSWALVTVLAMTQAGVRSPVVIAYPVILMLIGWLFSARAAITMGALTVAVILGIVAADIAGLHSVRSDTPALMHGLVQILLTVLSVFMIVYLIRSYKSRLTELNRAGLDLVRRTQELQTSQTNLAIAIESTRIVFWEYDLQNDELRYDEAALEWLGVGGVIPPHNLAGWLARVHPDDRAPFMKSFAKAAQPSAAAFEFDYRVSVEREVWIWHHTRGTVVTRDSTGKAVMVAGGSLNITERKQVEFALQESQARAQDLANMLRLMCDNVTDMIWAKDLNNRYIFANKAMCDQLLNAVDTTEPVGKSDLFFALRERQSHSDNPQWHTFGEICADSDMVTLQNGKASQFDEFGNVRGEFVFFDVHKAPFVNAQGEVIGVVGVGRDVTKQKAVEDRLRQTALVLENSSEGLMVTDAENWVIEINPAFTRLTGYSREEAIGQSSSLLKSGRNAPELYRAMWESLRTEGRWQGEIWNRRKDGKHIAEWLTINTLYAPDGTVYRRVALYSDITEKKKSDDLIWMHANFDALTHLPNRRMFHDRLTQEIKKVQRSGLKLALLFLDLDRFKEVNDTLGHGKGDELLIEAARRIVACVRDSDTVARIGGDEFTVILTEFADLGSVERVARSINLALSEPFQLGVDVAHVSVSVGIGLCPQDAMESDKLLIIADQAMYAAKAAGRNRFAYLAEEKSVK